jgi:simple sugar transport system permease protein
MKTGAGVLDTRNVVLASMFVAIVAFFSATMPRTFLSLANFQSIAFQIPELGLLTLAMMVVMMTGGIDLSIVSIASLSGIVGAFVLTSSAASDPGAAARIGTTVLGIAAILAVSAACGTLNGLFVSRVGFPPILGTLGTKGVFLGLGMILTGTRGIIGFPQPFLAIGTGTVGGIPAPFLIFLLAAFVIALLLNRTAFGMRLRLTGSNAKVARYSGLKVPGVLLGAYLISGLLCGMSSLIMIARVNSAKSGYGEAYLLQAIIVAILGGIDPAGGKGKVTGIVISIVLLQVIQSGFNILGISVFVKNVVFGFLLIAVLVINHVIGSGRERSHAR